MFGLISQIANSIGNAISNVANGIGSAVGDIVSTVGKIGQQVIDGVSSVGQQIINGVTTLISGLFGDTETTKVATFVGRLIPDESIPNATRQAIIEATLSNKEPSQLILNKLMNGFAVKGEKAYAYGKKNYTFGVPSKTLFSDMTSENIMKREIEKLIGESITFDYFYYGRENYLHTYGWMYVITAFKYDSVTNELTLLSEDKKTPVYLKDIVVTVKEDTFNSPFNNVLNQQGISPSAGRTTKRFFSESRGHTPIQIGDTHTVTISYEWLGPVTQTIGGIVTTITDTIEESRVIQFNPEKTGGYYQMCYRRVSDITSKREYVSYRSGSGTFPILDRAYQANYNSAGSFFPMIHFRNNKAPVHSNNRSKEYKSSAKMLKYWGLEYDDIAKAISANQDVNDIEQAFIMMGVPAVTSNKYEQEYLFDFFSLMYLAKTHELSQTTYNGTPGVTNNLLQSGQVTNSAFVNVMKEFVGTLGSNTQLTKIPSLSLIIQDQLFKMGLNCSEIKRVVKAGSIGPVNSFSSSLDHEEIINQTSGSPTGAILNSTPKVSSTYLARHSYRKQVSETSYIELSVYGLNLTYYVHGSYNTVGLGNAPSLLVPLDHSITTNYSSKKKEILYARSLHLVINSRRVQVVKWYERLLGDVLKIAAIVLLVYSLGSAAQGAYALATAGASLSAVATYFANQIGVFLLESLAISTGARIIVDNLGTDAAMLFAVIAAIYVGNRIYTNGGSTAGLTSADKALAAGSVGVTNESAKYYADEIKKISAEMETFSLESKNKMEEIDKAEKLLQRDNVVSSILVWGETPQNFYDRTIHTGNIGTLAFDEVTYFVDIALSLPKMHQTIDV